MVQGIYTALSSQVVQKAVENSQMEVAKPQASPEGKSFQEILNSTETHKQVLEVLGVNPENQVLPKGNIESLSANSIPLGEDYNAVSPVSNNTGDKVLNLLSDFNHQQSQMDLLVNQIMYGEKKFSNQELLAIQAHVFHIAQMTELTVKSVELAVSSFKGVMNTPIQ